MTVWISICYVLRKGYEINETNMYLERIIIPEWITVKCYIFIGRVHSISKIGMILQHSLILTCFPVTILM